MVCLFLGLILIGWFFNFQHNKARRDWKNASLLEITRLADDKEWQAKEIAILQNPVTPPNPRVIQEKWLTDRMILMRNGEWLIYKNHCPEVEPYTVRDIFLAKGSNGKWYYSTCHFCVGMCALIMMQESFIPGHPASIRTFAKHYFLQEFDGKSIEGLQKTPAFPDLHSDTPDPDDPIQDKS